MDHCGKFKFDSTFLAFEFFGFILVHCVTGAKLVLTNGVSISFVSDSVSPPISTMNNYLYKSTNLTMLFFFSDSKIITYYFLSSLESKGPIIFFIVGIT